MQTCLEKRGITARNEHLVRNDYNKDDYYYVGHPDAISNGDPQGKGSQTIKGHTHSTPDCNKFGAGIDYSNFDTSDNVGGLYDIEGRPGLNGGRNYLKAISVYNSDNQYNKAIVDTIENQLDGQIVLHW